MNCPEFILELPCGVSIERRLTPLDAIGIKGATERDMGNRYCWYDLPHSDISGACVAIALCFKGQALDTLTLALVDTDLYGKGWNEWSEAKERLRTKDTQNWLRSMGYSTGRFLWGEIWAEFDAKGGGGGGGVRYFLA